MTAGNGATPFHRVAASIAAVSLFAATLLPGPAMADNQMGYQLLSQQEASGLSRNRGSLGMDIERGQRITDGGMAFDIIRLKQVRRGSPGAEAGFGPGDQIIAVDGRVFSSLASFAAYIGSIQPGSTVTVDYIPANGGPAQAQRVAVRVGGAGNSAQPPSQPPAPTGMSTGEKVAIGVGAAALFGCYEMGCFSKRRAAQGVNGGATEAPGVYPRQAYPQQQAFPQRQ